MLRRTWPAVIFLVIGGSLPASAQSAPRIGDWTLNGMNRPLPDTSRGYNLENRLTDDKHSPWLGITCTERRYVLRFFVDAAVKSDAKGSFAIAIDGKKPLVVVATKIDGFGQSGFFQGELSPADLARLSETRMSLTVASPAMPKTFTFNASETARAIRVLRTACDG